MQKHRLVLRSRSLRATPARMKMLAILEREQKPVTAEELHKKIRANLVTVYRILQSLVSAKLVREVRFKDSIVRYEIAAAEHHHHLVCTTCGDIDELPECDVSALEKNALSRSQKFASVSEHALEFFGTCVECAKR